MLKRLGRTNTPGIFRWKIWLRLPGGIVHTHVELTEAAAMKLYSDLLERKARTELALPASGTVGVKSLGQAADGYLVELQGSGYNARHCEQVRSNLALLRSMHGDDVALSAINREVVQRWRLRRQAGESAPGASTVNKGLVHLSAFFNWCCRQGWLESNPAQYAQRIKAVAPAMKILMWADYCKFMDALWRLRPVMAVLFEVIGETGARVGEVLRARVGDVDLRRRIWTKTVKPGKTLESDAGEWVQWVAEGRKAGEWLCPTEKGEGWTYSCVRQALDSLSGDLGLDFVVHSIRHGRACWDLAEGKSVWDVKTKLGHSSVVVTEGYLRAANTIKRAEADGTVHARRVAMCCEVGRFCDLLRLMAKNSYGKHFSYKTSGKKKLE